MDKLEIIEKKKKTFYDAMRSTAQAMDFISYVIAYAGEYNSTDEEVRAYVDLLEAHGALKKCYEKLISGGDGECG